MADSPGHSQLANPESNVPDDGSDSVEAAGHFRIYLGAAAGVGKTYAMLNEGHRRKSAGRRCRHRVRGVPRTASHRGADWRISRWCRDGSSNTGAAVFEEMDLDARPPASPQGGTRRRARAHQRPRFESQREAVAGRHGAARRRHRRHHAPSTSSTSRASPMRSNRSPACRSRNGCPTGYFAKQTRSNSSTHRPNNSAAGCCTATSIHRRRSPRP